MPEIPSPYNELPLVKNLDDNTRLTIVKAVVGETEKNSYTSVTLTTLEHGDMFSIDAGVLECFIKIGAGDRDLSKSSADERKQFLNEGAGMVSEKDPLVVRKTTFKNKYGKLSATLKNSD